MVNCFLSFGLWCLAGNVVISRSVLAVWIPPVVDLSTAAGVVPIQTMNARRGGQVGAEVRPVA